MTEEELIAFIKENQNQFYLMAYSYVKNEQMALDVVQESIYRGFKNYKKVREPQYMKTWFCRIVMNVSLDFLRKEKRFVHNEEIFEQIAVPQKNRSDENLDLYEAVGQLDLESRTIITLRFFEDMKIEEIANVMELNINTIKSKLYRALKILKKELAGGHGYEF